MTYCGLLLLQVLSFPAPVNALPMPTLDTTIVLHGESRLKFEASSGHVAVSVWDRTAVRVVANERAGTSLRFDKSGGVITITAAATSGGIDEGDYTIIVPRRMSLTVGSGDLAIDLAGTEGGAVLKNYSGKITVSGTRGSISARSVLGEIEVSDALGPVSVRALNAAVRLTNISGAVDVESTRNHLYLTNVDAWTLSASSVAGVIWFTGPFHENGHYSFATHSGSVFLSVSGPVNVTLDVGTVSGAFSTALPSIRTEGARRGHFKVRVGTGAAAVDVETFNGGIVLGKIGRLPTVRQE